MSFRKLILGTSNKKEALDTAMFVTRLYFGFSLAFAHGLGKLPPSDGFVSGISEMGFPIPLVFAWAAGLAELVGGIFLGLGLFTRPSSFFVILTMLVAAFIRHGDDPYSSKEKAIMFGVVAFFFLVVGPGKISADRKLGIG